MKNTACMDFFPFHHASDDLLYAFADLLKDFGQEVNKEIYGEHVIACMFYEKDHYVLRSTRPTYAGCWCNSYGRALDIRDLFANFKEIIIDRDIDAFKKLLNK